MAQRDRYHRQRLLPQITDEGQERLRDACVLIVGCGALGCVAADWLARAGVGMLRLVDQDLVSETNLHRQTLFTLADAHERTPKAHAACARLEAVNNQITIDAHAQRATPGNIERLCGEMDIIVDAVDNFETRFLLNDAAVKLGLPLVHAGVVGTSATGAVIVPLGARRSLVTGCLRCMLRDVPTPGSVATCDTAGVLGPMVGMIASWQAIETIKLLVGDEDALTRGLVAFDGWNAARGLSVRTLPGVRERDAECPACGRRVFAFLDRSVPTMAAERVCGERAIQLVPGRAVTVDLETLARRLANTADLRVTRFLVRANVDHQAGDGPLSLTVFPDGRAIVGNTEDETIARSVYERYVGV
jgi:molybdopterin-synthase adenylyltransferase